MIRLYCTFLILPISVLSACSGGKDSAADTGTDADDSATGDSNTDDSATDDSNTDDSAADDSNTDDSADDTAPDSDTGVPAPLALSGAWDDGWGGQHTVSDDRWISGTSGFAITQYDNAAAYAIAQNDAGNAWNPGLWSRFDWTYGAAGAVYYCQTAYDAATEADALATPAADGADLAGGCGGFSWTELRPTLAVSGAWDDSWGGSHEISAFVWRSGDSAFWITQADPAGWAVAQNDAGNAWNPGLWSRFDWTQDGSGALWYCQTAYDAATEADALAAVADPSDPGAGGCGGFSWTQLTPAVRP